MLLELVIENYAVVDRLRARFHPGLNLLTGETGSGKSIVVDALGLLFGGRAAADMVRSGEARARVAGIFDVRGDSRVAALLEPAGFTIEEGELLVEREILAGGKSRAFLGSRPVAASLLRELAPFLGDIHGQHDQQSLFFPEAQREMLDAFAENATQLSGMAQVFADWRGIGAELDELERSEQEKLRLLDLWSFQRREIESASPQPGEDAALEGERRVLLNLEKLQENAAAAWAALYDAPDSALAQVRLASRRVDELARIDPAPGAIRENLEAAALSLEEAAYALRDYLGRLEANPGRLEEVEARLAVLDRLKRKYGRTIEEILVFLEEVRGHIEAIENAGERMEALRARRRELGAAYEKLARELSSRRAAAARKLDKRVEAELASLAMNRTIFRVDLAPGAWTPEGADRIEFLVSPNVGEQPRPIAKVASGGEISRIALALKTCLAATHPGPDAGPHRTLVFDEVDAGVGGAAAEGVGRRLRTLAAANQVLCVTHLPQIACFADHHYRVDKGERNGRTMAALEELDAEARIREIGRMLSGQKLTPEALRHAGQMIRAARA